ncbi:MAG: hypothetical protein JXA21_02790 [Anaerolineae bacterium]|nr:hypothetical protein [Anaerolineae bacterium]
MGKVGNFSMRVMLAAAIWCIALQSGLYALRGVLARVTPSGLYGPAYTILSVLAMILYPLLISYLMKRRTSLWANSLLFGQWGGVLGSMGFTMVQSLFERHWTTALLIVAVMGFIVGIANPKTHKMPALKEDRDIPPAVWEALNSLSLLSLLFLQVPFLSDTEG